MLESPQVIKFMFLAKSIKLYMLKNHFHSPPWSSKITNRFKININKLLQGTRTAGRKAHQWIHFKKRKYSIKCLFHPDLTSYQGQKCLSQADISVRLLMSA